MALLKREDFAKLKEKLRFRDVACPELGGEIRVWELTGAARDVFMAEHDPARPDSEQKAALVRACAGDESGPFAPPLTMAELTGLPRDCLDRLFVASADVSAVGKAAAEEARGN